MKFYQIHIKHSKDSSYDVYYKTDMSYSNIPRQAVIDGDLISSHLPFVEFAKEISSENYHEYMFY